MFGPSSHHPHGCPPRHNGPYPAHSPQLTVGASLLPPAFPMHGRGAGFHSSFHGGLSHGFPSSGLPLLVRPPPPPGSPPMEAPPPPPTTDGNFRSTGKSAPPPPPPPPPPPMPKDPEMLKNIEILSCFVVKNGPQFENMARAKQAGDPKFSFLFGGERGTDAALGFDFYNWKKEHVMWVEERTRASPADQKRLFELNLQVQHGGHGFSHDSPASPAGSDMDMEDDFSLQDPAPDKKAVFDKSPSLLSNVIERKSGLSPSSTDKVASVSSPGREWKPTNLSTSLDGKAALSLLASERKAVLPHESVELKVCIPLNVPIDRDSPEQVANIGLPIHLLLPELQCLAGSAHGDETARVADVSRSQREIRLVRVPKRRDTRRQTGFDRPCMEDVSAKSNPESHLEHPRRRLSVPDKILETSEAASIEKEYKRADSFTLKGVESSSANERRQSPDGTARPSRVCDDGNLKDNEQLKTKSASAPPVVDEYGRLLRQGSSDSDVDDNHYGGRKKQRRTSSRSRSGSRPPGDIRFKHWSPGHSPRGWGKRSRSWSPLPRKNKSCSHTPARDARRGEEGRGGWSISEKGGRRGGRALGGPRSSCFNFLKGKCFRGSACRFLHDDSQGGISDQGVRWSGGQGRDREQHQIGKVLQEGDQSLGGRSGDNVKLQRSWESEDWTVVDDSTEMKVTEGLRKQEHRSSLDESLKQAKGSSENPVKSAKNPDQIEYDQQVKSSAELSRKGFTPYSASPSEIPFQSTISMGTVSQGDQEITVLSNLVLSQQESVLSSNAKAAARKLSSMKSPVSQNSLLMVSPTPKSPLLQCAPVLSHLQQPGFSPMLQSQNPAYRPLLSPSQSNGFASNALHQQPVFTPGRNVLSGSPPLQNLQPVFAALPLGRSQSSFNISQLPNFGQFPNTSGHGSIQFRPTKGAQLQMLPSPLVQSLHLRPGPTWIPGDAGPPPSYSLGQAQSLQPPPPQVSCAPARVYSYGLPSSYTTPSYSRLLSKDVAARPQPLIHDQYDPLSDSLEPAPPGSVEKQSLVSNNQSSTQENSGKPLAMQHWRHNSGCVSARLMAYADEVVLENVSPGLPSHVENVAVGASGILGNVSPVPQPQMFMENISPTDVDPSINEKDVVTLGGSQKIPKEKVSPLDQERNEAGEENAPKTTEEKKNDKVGRVLNLIRKAVAEHVKDLLKPTWKGGQMSKDAFKTIAKKAVDKVMGALEVKGQIPKTREKLDVFMNTSKPKIARLVQGYVDKYLKV